MARHFDRKYSGGQSRRAGTRSTSQTPFDGLFVSRILGTPLLSGLAALGGVLLAATLPTLGGQKAPELSTIFSGTVTLEYFFAAAIFGYAPNLIIGSLQQRAQKFSTDLQNSKGEGAEQLAKR